MSEPTKRRPWWAAALAGGFGAVLGTGALLGFAGSKTHEAVAAVQAPAYSITNGEPLPAHPFSYESQQRQQSDLSDRLMRMELKIDALTEKVARIEGRLERR